MPAVRELLTGYRRVRLEYARTHEAPRVVRRCCQLAFVGLFVYLGLTGVRYIADGTPDFEYFYKGGASVLLHGSLDPGFERAPSAVDNERHHFTYYYWPFSEPATGPVIARGKLDWYWPFVPRFMTLFAWMPYPLAGLLWLSLNLAGLFAILRMIGRNLMGLTPGDWPVTLLLPFVFLLVFWHWEFHLNQINILTMLLLVGSYVLWERKRPHVAGFWLGLAVLLKVTPMLLVVWFAMKRQFRTLGVALLTILLAGPAADAVVFGPSAAAEQYRSWVYNAVTAGSHRGLVLAQREMDWRNQGLGAVLSRWLHPTNYNTHFVNEPRATLDHAPKTLNVANLPLETIAAIATVLSLVTLAGLFWLVRRPAAELGVWQLRVEWALLFLAMLWFMPVMRRYHMIWCFPALALIAAAIHHLPARQPWSVMALICAWLVALGQVALPSKVITGANLLEGYGLLLFSVVLLGVPLIALLFMLGRGKARLPESDISGNPGVDPPPVGTAPGPAGGGATVANVDG